MRRWIDEFKTFAFRGNLVEIAVGLVLALAFTNVVNALVNGVLMPLIAAIFGQPNFDAIVWTIGSPPDQTPIFIGRVITALVNFLLIAWALFLIVKLMNRVHPATPEDTGPTEVQLLTEIRDELKGSRGIPGRADV